MGETTERMREALLTEVPQLGSRIAAMEIRLGQAVGTLGEMRTDIKELIQSMTGCRERCDASRATIFDRMRSVESEQERNRGAHEHLKEEKARHPHVHIAGATYAVFGITAVLVIVEVIKLLKG